MDHLSERISSFFNNKWLVFVAAMWMQSCAGIGYLFGSISPTIKSCLNYNQKEIARLGVAKDLGGSLGFVAGFISELLPMWGTLFIGLIQNFVGYGLVWLVVTGRASVPPLWAMCFLIFVGSNGGSYFDTVALVTCVKNFPKSRGPVVGILKGFAGLSGAILTQIYAVLRCPDNVSLILMVAVGPTMVIAALLFIVRPVDAHDHKQSSDGFYFSIINSICLLLAAYLMGVMLIQDLVNVGQTEITIFTVILLVILVIPIGIPIKMSFSKEPNIQLNEPLLSQRKKAGDSGYDGQDILFSEIEDERSNELNFLPASDRQNGKAQSQAQQYQESSEGTAVIKKQQSSKVEEFTLCEALTMADFWLIFFSLLLGSGSGLTVLDNLGQMSQSLGYENAHVFVSLISIWNFLGRVGGGLISEKVARDYAYPRPAAMACAQVIMAIGHFSFAMGWSGAMYIGTLLVGLGYGAHWAIVPATASELFGLKKFGVLYNLLTLANPTGSFIFSGIIASSIYDREAERQARQHPSVQKSFLPALTNLVNLNEPPKCKGVICFFVTFLIMSGFCILSVGLSMTLVYRTKLLYSNLYGRSQKQT